jgi:CarboxypepD_reg-like domain
MAKLLLVGLFSIVSFGLFAQTGSISGRVIDAETLEPLPFANVFINNSTLGMPTTPEGTFTINKIPIGTPEVVFSFVGYQTYQVRVVIKDGEDYKMNIKLSPLKEQLAEIQVKAGRDKVWERQLKKFEKIFLGSDDLGRQCKILNPAFIEFTDKEGVFKAVASAPIEVENSALGYKLTYYLKDFTSDEESYSIVGNARFEEIGATTAEEALRWQNNRKEAYLGSARHLYRSIVEERVAEEGFRLYVYKGAGALTARNRVFNQEFEKSIFPFKLGGVVTPGNNVYERRLNLGTRLEVHYLNEPSARPAYSDVSYAVSWLDLKSTDVRVSTEGTLLTPFSVVLSGDMGAARVSNMLPLDYQSQSVIKVKSAREVEVQRMFEKTYLQTSKAFYYPGEMIWFKSYMNYAVRDMIDTLSQVLYVELVDADRQVLQRKTVKLTHGSGSGNIKLPLQMKPGTYALVAYTNWMRNFSSKHYFVKPIPVLDIYERMTQGDAPKASNSRDLEVAFDKEKYAAREKVIVTLALTDEADKPVQGDFSVSVTDATQVPANTWVKEDIVPGFVIPPNVHLSAGGFTQRVEYGVTFKGEFVPSNKKRTKTEITIVKGSLDEVKKITTKEDGTFVLNDLDIMDSVLFSFQALYKGELYGTFAQKQRDMPIVEFKANEYKFPIERKNDVQRIISTYEIPNDAILMEGVEVKSTRLEEVTSETHNAFGKADIVIDGDAIDRAGSMETLLRTKAPQFRLYFDGLHHYLIHIRGEATLPAAEWVASTASGVNRYPEPALTIDNRVEIISSGETVGDRLMYMRTDNIDRIEISSVAGSSMGSNSAYGVVAVFMKRPGVDKAKFQGMYVRGYDRPGTFLGPDYGRKSEEHSQGDFRSTLYWKHDLIVGKDGKGEFSFYTSDLAGKYRVVIEGVNVEGKPIHVEKIIEVEEKK